MRNRRFDNDHEINHKRGAEQVILLGALLLFFGILWYVSPTGIYPDSGSYISMQPGREPLYPTFLAIFRRIFGENDRITWLAGSGQHLTDEFLPEFLANKPLRTAAFVQNVLAAFSCFFLTNAVWRVFCPGKFLKLLTACCTLIPYLLTPIASSSGMVLTNAILTEGIAFPLNGFFTGCMILALLEKDKKLRHYGMAFLASFLLAVTRNQMLVIFAVWCLAVLFEICRYRQWRAAFLLAAAAVLFLFGRRIVTEGYNRLEDESYVGADTGSYNLLTTILYLSDPSDAEAIGEPEYRELFLTLHEQMDGGEMTSAFAPTGVLNKAYHYEEYYDVIGFQVQQPILFEYVREQGAAKEQELTAVVKIASDLCRELLPVLFSDYAYNYFATVCSGLTRSISASGTIMGIYSLFAYFIAVILMVYLYYQNRQSKAALLMLFSLLMICANVFGTAVMIMCLSRYMIYHTSLFYIAGLMELMELWQLKKDKIAKKSTERE